ncbi:hypothetical protein Drose_26060 [Dactylosporangium roseum]|uniref:Uncharacterized protein n=1 Tax=Dactylosporangium roseum TaxID=47989 RepID=A0ABY5YZ59_9ACTN|nr:hypothetical protein [Dactylosporangium roseum]UWZ34669.1 hypothetical protein Drose_26060 [Dactylosporangium roseum]
MTSPIEDLIRKAQERQAQRAHAPDRLAAELPVRVARRVRRRRYQMIGTVAAAVAAAATLSVPVLGLRSGSDASPLQPGGRPSAASQDNPAGASTLPPVALGYRPTWLPSGFTERIRTAQPGPGGSGSALSVRRIWTDEPVGTDGSGGSNGIILTLRQAVAPGDPQANTGASVDINGIVGYYHGPQGGDDKAYVEWRADTGTVVSLAVHNEHLTQQDMLRIARSVRPDPKQLQVPLRLAWLPGGWSVTSGEISGDAPTAWRAAVTATQRNANGAPGDASTAPTGHSAGSNQRSISVSLSPTTTAPAGGESLTVNGLPARFVVPERPLSLQYLVVDLGEDKKLTVLGISHTSDPLNRNDLIRVAEQATAGDPAAAAWIATA